MVLGATGYSWLMGLSGVGAVLIKNSLQKVPHFARTCVHAPRGCRWVSRRPGCRCRRTPPLTAPYARPARPRVTFSLRRALGACDRWRGGVLRGCEGREDEHGDVRGDAVREAQHRAATCLGADRVAVEARARARARLTSRLRRALCGWRLVVDRGSRNRKLAVLPSTCWRW